jgi:nicotinate-nucleotide adenylyltransferase
MIGIFGGTFDPIHFGHLRVALDVLETLALDQVRFVPLKIAVHRNQPSTPPEIRLAMVRAAVAGQPGFAADGRELARDGPSYTLHTVQSLREELGDEPLCLLLGADAFNGFLDWHRPLEILRLSHLVIMQRPGANLPEEPRLRALIDRHLAATADELRAAPGGRMLFLPVTQLDISATDIRRRIAEGRSPRYLLPPGVEQILLDQALYRDR